MQDPWCSFILLNNFCQTFHGHTGIAAPPLPWGRGTQAVAAISGSWFRKKSAASGSNFQAEEV